MITKEAKIVTENLLVNPSSRGPGDERMSFVQRLEQTRLGRFPAHTWSNWTYSRQRTVRNPHCWECGWS